MFVTTEKERISFIFLFFVIFVSRCPLDFKLGQAERVQTTKAQSNRPRRQHFPM